MGKKNTQSTQSGSKKTVSVLGLFSREELLKIGFRSVGKDVRASKDARFFSIQGELGDGVRIDAFSIMTGHIRLGKNVHISPFSFLGGTGGVIQMGPHSGVSTGVSIFTKSADYSTPRLGDDRKLTGNVSIGDYSIIGAGSTVMPGSRIGKHTSIGCNSVIQGTIQGGSIIVSRGTGVVTLSKRTVVSK